MVELTSLVLPILLSAIVVFVASSIIHMMLRYHNNDFGKVPDEDGVMAALRPFALPPGDYMIPRPECHEDMKKAEYIEKAAKGPVALMTVMPSGIQGKGKSLALWFLYCVIVSLFAAYLTKHAVPAGTSYLTVFRFAGTTAFAGYALALMQNSIWYQRKWSSTAKSVFDGLIYALLTGGTFGWLWPA